MILQLVHSKKGYSIKTGVPGDNKFGILQWLLDWIYILLF